jgi:hypothetical protein
MQEPHNHDRPSELTSLAEQVLAPPRLIAGEDTLRWSIQDTRVAVACLRCPFEDVQPVSPIGHPWVPGAQVANVRSRHAETNPECEGLR